MSTTSKNFMCYTQYSIPHLISSKKYNSHVNPIKTWEWSCPLTYKIWLKCLIPNQKLQDSDPYDNSAESSLNFNLQICMLNWYNFLKYNLAITFCSKKQFLLEKTRKIIQLARSTESLKLLYFYYNLLIFYFNSWIYFELLNVQELRNSR